MASRKKQPTFAEIVRDVTTTAPTAEECRPGLRDDGMFVDRAGRAYRLVDPAIDGETAQRIATAGSVIVWDPCGCGGWCGYRWVEPDEARRLGSVVPRIRNTKRHQGTIALYGDDHGRELLLVEGTVSWGPTIQKPELPA